MSIIYLTIKYFTDIYAITYNKMEVSEKEKNQKLSGDMQIILQIILERVPENSIHSIILYGSYGRNEGAFYKSNGEIQTYNDYDLLLVTDSYIDKEKLEKLKILIKERINIKYIDLSQISPSKLKRLRPTIFNFDLKYGSSVIWGDEHIFNLIPAYRPEEITLEDAEKLYFTRLFTFLGSLDINGFEAGVEGEKARFFRNQMAKAILALVDIELIQHKSYHTSYRERVIRFINILPSDSDLSKKAQWALSEKLYPKNVTMTPQQVAELYNEVIQLFIEKMYDVLSVYYGSLITTTEDIRKAKVFSLPEVVTKLKHLVFYKSLQAYRKDFQIKMAQSYLAESYILTGIEKTKALEKCNIIIRKYIPSKNITSGDWNQLRLLTAELRLKGD